MPILNSDQLEGVMDTLRANPKVCGILLTGSYAYGTPNEASDIDIVCITNDGSDFAEFERMFNGVPANIFYNTPENARHKYMQTAIDEGHGDSVHFWANGKIVFDPTGIVKSLQEEARRIWTEGLPDGRSWEWRWEKHKGGYKPQPWESEFKR